jgi:hypothetical protein
VLDGLFGTVEDTDGQKMKDSRRSVPGDRASDPRCHEAILLEVRHKILAELEGCLTYAPAVERHTSLL